MEDEGETSEGKNKKEGQMTFNFRSPRTDKTCGIERREILRANQHKGVQSEKWG